MPFEGPSHCSLCVPLPPWKKYQKVYLRTTLTYRWIYGLVAPMLDSSDIEHFHHCRKFFWRTLLQRVSYSPFWVSLFGIWVPILGQYLNPPPARWWTRQSPPISWASVSHLQNENDNKCHNKGEVGTVTNSHWVYPVLGIAMYWLMQPSQ